MSAATASLIGSVVNGNVVLAREGRSIRFRCRHGIEFIRWFDQNKLARYRCPCALKTSNNLKHGMMGTPEYQAWKNMRTRCNNHNFKDFHIYGGRGIAVCARWDSFENFYADMGRRPGTGFSLDRIDNDLDYGPGNCRWASAREQACNRRYCVQMTFNGETKLLTEWADALGIRRSIIYDRITKHGWDTDRALTQPVRRRV